MEDKEILSMHAKNQGVLNIAPQFEVKNRKELGEAYTPGVAIISKLIERYPELKDKYTLSGKLVALVTDGSAVLGLGNIGPAGGLPVVEGKALLYKDLANVNALPLTVEQVPVDEFVATLKNMQESFAGFHLEDIKAPRCFEIEEKLSKVVTIPVYHDDQEGTAIVVLAGLINAARVVKKNLKDLKVIINGVGASGVATARLLFAAGIKNITFVDIDGPVHVDSQNYNHYQTDLVKQSADQTPYKNLSEAVKDRDVFIGLSDADVLTSEQVKTMAKNPIIFALANPKPEIDPQVAKDADAAVMATGSSQYPNQVNNILVFPGLYKGLLSADLNKVDFGLEKAIASALANMISNPTAEKIVPGVFDDGVVNTVAKAVQHYASQKNND
ncbi:NADP-dependent malic enzyme [Limosilactobacillus reuteri]|jgi:malate dehydrogenase (oxaloacetate-decarboxylating)|uniref:NADP-dependent malic enzyme n=1 Tax=Limosilactobacillus reuteri TaxID=1598 RepID=A0A4S2E388_LIMRT|nr:MULTISPECIES: malic enzyme-like NAD(P)-binding protein [Lactobacillaceae]MBU5283469.1 NADP-dependent malic enzyme [Limosilactobacillus reuteri]MCC4331264.1 NADP-dependent malic enzyme [Limosilactobacillus reuteri]MCC4353576.1 NADP-dependent malic enzyme [Limosilactobacillus reuteri]MCC4394985.1 NADP-dependent malic enzyme [Limosilactobacillus reuteri]MCC4401805.1 NADP-dependent malic enzyme [Limosilactobacillus reuteri]